MRRRDLIKVLAYSVTALPIAVRAQQPVKPVIGFINTRDQNAAGTVLSAFRQGLKEANLIEGQNVTIEYRWAENKYDRLPILAAELVRLQANIIVANGPAAVAAKAATANIPIVFYTAGDPIKMGFVESLKRPGGNLTGVTTLGAEVGSKRVQLLHEMVPTAKKVAVLVNPKYPVAETEASDMQAAARSLGLEAHVLYASDDPELGKAFGVLARIGAEALAIGPDPFFTSRSKMLGTLALDHAIPTIYQYRDFTAAGGLISYGIGDWDLYRLLGVTAGRILKGDTPGDIPVQQLAKVELIINLKTAKSLGINVPNTLIGRADEVIE
jgi:putative ABC transport system substrate-binding protein